MPATSPSQPAASAANATPGRFSLYLVIVLLIPLLAFLVIFPYARSGFFMRTSRRQFWHAMEYQFAPRPQSCDVLIFGDSTGLMGADPRIITARTGLSACNIAIPYMGLSTTGKLTLDHFLATHQPPRFLVIEVHPSHLRPPALDDESGIIDGFLLADRKLPPLAATKFFLDHPRNSFYFAAQLWKDLISFTPSARPDLSQQTWLRDTAALSSQKGFFTTGFPGGTTDCYYQFHAPTFSQSWLHSYDRYATHGTRVVIWPSPVRHCDVHQDDYRAGTQFLGVPPPLLLNDDAFTDAQHLSSTGVQQNSNALATFLMQQK
jgi:hypothetical protein